MTTATGGSTGSNGSVTEELVYAPDYVNDVLSRDTYVSGSYSSRVFFTHDANYDVTGVVQNSTAGTMLQRMTYDAYGNVTFLTSSWATTTDGYAVESLWQGGWRDANTGYYHFQNRWYSPSMQWLSWDPANYPDGPSAYLAVDDNPIGLVDPAGLQALTVKIDTDTSSWDPHRPIDYAVMPASKVPSFLESLVTHDRVRMGRGTTVVPATYSDTGTGPHCNCISELDLAGHGASGAANFEDGDEGHYVSVGPTTIGQFNDIQNSEKARAAAAKGTLSDPGLAFLKSIAQWLCKDATVSFITCSTGAEPDFAPAVKAIFASYGKNVKLIVYNYPVEFTWGGEISAPPSDFDGPEPWNYDLWH